MPKPTIEECAEIIPGGWVDETCDSNPICFHHAQLPIGVFTHHDDEEGKLIGVEDGSATTWRGRPERVTRKYDKEESCSWQELLKEAHERYLKSIPLPQTRKGRFRKVLQSFTVVEWSLLWMGIVTVLLIWWVLIA